MRGAAGAAGHPPPGSRKASRRIRPRPRILLLVRRPCLGDDLPMRRLPQPHRTVVLSAQDDSVIPPPHHDVRAVRSGSNRDQMARRHSLGPRGGEHRGEPGRANFAVAPDLTRILVGTYHARGAQAVRGGDGIGLLNRHVSESDKVTTRSDTVYTPAILAGSPPEGLNPRWPGARRRRSPLRTRPAARRGTGGSWAALRRTGSG